MTTKIPLRYLFIAFTWFILLPIARADDLPRGEAKAAGFAVEKLDGFQKVLKQAVDKKEIAGASTLLARKGKVVSFMTVGMQDVEAKTPMAESTIFRIASMSKPITSAAIMILVDDGKINTTDLLSKYVPEFKEMMVLVPSKDEKTYELVKANREITIHDLLTHTSGITYRLMNKPHLGKLYAEAGGSDGISETPGTIGDNVKKLAKLPLVCQPGAAWEYGLNTDVLGYVVEVASGKTLNEFCRERIFKPLKMNDTAFNLPKDKQARLAALYTIGADTTIARAPDKTVITEGAPIYSPTFPTHADNKYFSGGGGLVASAGDYFRFCQMILNRGELDGIRVLKAETVDRMTKNQMGELRIAFPGASVMGYGFGVLDAKSKEETKDPTGVGTYSWGGAFGTFFWVDPKNEVVAVFMSQMMPPDFKLSQQFKVVVYEALGANK